MADLTNVVLTSQKTIIAGGNEYAMSQQQCETCSFDIWHGINGSSGWYYSICEEHIFNDAIDKEIKVMYELYLSNNDPRADKLFILIFGDNNG